MDARPINIARIDTEGADFGLSWRWSTRYGDYSPKLAATWVAKFEQQLTETSPVDDRLAIVSGTPRWKGRVALDWAYEDDVHAALIGRWVSAFQDSEPLATGPGAGTTQILGDFWMFDLNVDLGVGAWLASGESSLSDTRLSVGAVNLFNRLPDFCNGCSSRGYDPTQYEIRGRLLYADLKFGF